MNDPESAVSPYLPSDMPEALQPERRSKARQAWDQQLRTPLGLGGATKGIPEAWFLGPRAENQDLLKELIIAALDSHAAFRRSFHPDDPSHITPAIRASAGFQDGVAKLRAEVAVLLDKLQLSAPFTSMRYQGHMLWDQAMPAVIGLFAGMLYNQNNVAAEASPITTRLEIEVGNDLCRMLGYKVPEDGTAPKPGHPAPWGHITSGGTVANIEALWAARNLKFSAVAIRQAIREVPALSFARGLEVPLWQGGMARLIDLDTWTLLNLDLDTVAGVAGRHHRAGRGAGAADPHASRLQRAECRARRVLPLVHARCVRAADAAGACHQPLLLAESGNPARAGTERRGDPARQP